MRVLTVNEVNFVSGGSVTGEADPYSLSASGGFRGTGMPNPSGNSIGGSNYSPLSQSEACADASNTGYAAAGTGGIATLAAIVLGVSSPAAVVAGVVTGILGITSGALGLGNSCSAPSGGGSDSSSGSGSGNSCPNPSTGGGG